jgi:tRNA (guanine9-N1)-methyltransferase
MSLVESSSMSTSKPGPLNNKLGIKDPALLPDCSKLSWEEAKIVGLSKNQWRKQKRIAEKLEKRPIKRQEERERRKAQRKAEKENGTFNPKPQKYRMAESSNKQRIAIDLSFFDYMVIADGKNALTQVGYCYSSNRRNPNPFQFYACGVDDKVSEIAKTIGVFQNWDMHIIPDKIDEVFDKSEIVYLCAESDNVLEELDEKKVYIIGGLVDHNHHKGLCYGISQEKGYLHARLPIEENMKLDSRKVLTINHVFDILVNYDLTKDWKKALLTVMPERKRKLSKNQEEKKKKVKELKTEYQNSGIEEMLMDKEIKREDTDEEMNTVGK